MPIGDIAPALALIIGAVVSLLIALVLPRERQWVCAITTLATLLVAASLTMRLQLLEAPKLSFSGCWALDDLTAWGSYAILGTSALVILLSPSWFATDRRHGEWYVMLLFSTLGGMLMAGAADLMELMVAMLLSSVTGYTLASYHRGSRMCAEAGAKYYFLGALANPAMFMGIVLLYGLAADTAYTAVGEGVRGGEEFSVALAAGLGLVVIGLAFKLGAVPGHAWVPDVAQGSPAPAAAFLTVVPKIAALIALVRVFWLIPDTVVAWRWVMALLAVLTMSLGNLAALWQTDLRRLLGWSSVSQAGYGLLAVVAIGESTLAPQALVLFICGYALGNLTAFGVVVALRGRTSLADYSGLSRNRPWHAAVLTLGLLSLTGIPPLIGFAAKLALFGAAIQAGFAWLALLAVANTVLSLFYYLRVVATMYLGDTHAKILTLDRSSHVALGAAASLIIVMGLGAQLILGPDVAVVTAGW